MALLFPRAFMDGIGVVGIADVPAMVRDGGSMGELSSSERGDRRVGTLHPDSVPIEHGLKYYDRDEEMC